MDWRARLSDQWTFLKVHWWNAIPGKGWTVNVVIFLQDLLFSPARLFRCTVKSKVKNAAPWFVQDSLVGRLGFTPVLLPADLLHIQKHSKRFHAKQVGKKESNLSIFWVETKIGWVRLHYNVSLLVPAHVSQYTTRSVVHKVLTIIMDNCSENIIRNFIVCLNKSRPLLYQLTTNFSELYYLIPYLSPIVVCPWQPLKHEIPR